MCLRWGLARILRVSGGNAVRGLLSWDAYVEWSEAELGKQNFLPRLCNSDSLSHTRLSRDPLRNTHRTITATSPFNHHQSSFSPRTPPSSLVIVWAHPSDALPFLSSGLPRYLSCHLSRIPSCHQRNGARPSRIFSLARYIE
jgi:hypothetical protein